MATPEPTRWILDDVSGGIFWNVGDADNPSNTLPHSDHVEMSGRRVSVIVRYRVDENRRLFVERDIFFPQLRVRENDVRGYLRRIYNDHLILPRFVIDGKEWFPDRTPIKMIYFDGSLVFLYESIEEGLQVSRRFYPSYDRAIVIERWAVINDTGRDMDSKWFPRRLLDQFFLPSDHKTRLTVEISPETRHRFEILSNDSVQFSHILIKSPEYTVWLDSEGFTSSPANLGGSQSAYNARLNRARFSFVERIQTDPVHIAFDCPDPEINTLFTLCKLRAAESLFDTDLMGLVHSPGGGNYYCGIWANDQCEYANPFFAFLNDADANEAAVNAYRHYAKHMTTDYAPVPTSFEMGGHIPYHAGGDRGDAAMIASGLSRYLLVRGDRDLARELYPALAWCNEYNRRKTDPVRGVVLSDTDELEGRFPTGDANLSTSVLAYDGLMMGAHVARELGHAQDADAWNAHAETLAVAIESHFGATVEGFETYRYYDGNTVLRSWICLPLVFGLAQGKRKTGTVNALFSPRLWTPDGLATQAGDTTFWDRSTLYGLRGAFIAGATEPAYEHLLAYSRRRLLGDHVPYPVEAYPENAGAHLSAESALYCRVFLEGLLGIAPTGFASFTLTPRLPEAWDEYRCRFTAFGNRDIAIHVRRENGHIAVTVSANGARVYAESSATTETHTIFLPVAA